jgi:hypothetical protein
LAGACINYMRLPITKFFSIENTSIPENPQLP